MHATLQLTLSVCWLVGPSVGLSARLSVTLSYVGEEGGGYFEPSGHPFGPAQFVKIIVIHCLLIDQSKPLSFIFEIQKIETNNFTKTT